MSDKKTPYVASAILWALNMGLAIGLEQYIAILPILVIISRDLSQILKKETN